MKTDDLIKQKAKSDSEALYHQRKAEAYAADSTKIADQHGGDGSAAMRPRRSPHLLQSQIERAAIMAPFDGEILKGDLSDKKDVPVKEGEEQMVFGQSDQAAGGVDGERAGYSGHQQKARTGSLATTSKPMDKVKFTVDRDRAAGPAQGRQQRLHGVRNAGPRNPSWRPGMAGEARVDVGKRTWAWIWTHRLMEFVRIEDVDVNDPERSVPAESKIAEDGRELMLVVLRTPVSVTELPDFC